MKRLRFLIIGLFFLCFVIEVSGQSPTVIDAKKLPELIRALPDYVGFGYEGAAYLGGDLYVSCNLGLVVVKARKPAALYQWSKVDGVVDGPWVDAASKAIWIQQAANDTLVRFDGEVWLPSALPEPENGYTRGDMLSGFRGVSSAGTFWFIGGGVAWQWQPSGREWFQEPVPAMPAGSQLKTFVRLGGTNVMFARLGYAKGLEGKGDSATIYSMYRFVGTWKKKEVGDINLQEVQVIGQVAYVRTEDGGIYTLTADALTRIDVPGPCEAITQTTDGLLLGFFGKAGVFARVDKHWELRVESPFAANEGGHRTHLAEKAGEVALVTAMGSRYNDKTDKIENTGQAGIWLSKGTKFERVDTVASQK